MTTTTITVSSPAQNLTSSEQACRATFEDTMRRTQDSYIEYSMALMGMRDGKLYRNTHKTFEAYCEDQWDMSRRRAYQLIDAANVFQNVNNCTQNPPANEGQARVLARIEPEQQVEVWEEVVSSAPRGKDGKPRVTAASVQRVADRMKLKVDGQVPSDEFYDLLSTVQPKKDRSKVWAEAVKAAPEGEGVTYKSLGGIASRHTEAVVKERDKKNRAAIRRGKDVQSKKVKRVRNERNTDEVHSRVKEMNKEMSQNMTLWRSSWLRMKCEELLEIVSGS